VTAAVHASLVSQSKLFFFWGHGGMCGLVH